MDKVNFHALNRASDRPGVSAAQVASMANPAFGRGCKFKPTWSAAKCYFPSDPPFSGPFLLNQLLIAQHFPMWDDIPSLFQINTTAQIQDGKTVSEREQSLTQHPHATYFEIRLPPRFTQTALVRGRAGVARQLKTLAAARNAFFESRKDLI